MHIGRKCDDPDCQGPLKDTIVNFGENLPEDEITKAFAEGNSADLCLVMGSSCTVTPAASIPEVVYSNYISELIDRIMIFFLECCSKRATASDCQSPTDTIAQCCLHGNSCKM